MFKEWLDIIYEILVSPSKALRKVIEERPFGRALLTAVFIAVVLSLSFLLNPHQFIEVIFDLKRGSFNNALAVLLWVLVFLTALFIEGGIFHLMALLFRGRGNYLRLVCALSFACVPFIFFAPLTFIRSLLGAGGPVLYASIYPFLFFWVFILAVNTIRLNYNFSPIKAAAIYFIPGILLIAIPAFVITVILPLG